MNTYRGQVDTNNAIINANDTKNGANGVKCGVDDGTNSAEVPLNKEQTQIEKLLQIIEKNPSATQAYYAEEMGISKRTVSRMFVPLQEKGRLVQSGTKRKANWKIIRQEDRVLENAKVIALTGNNAFSVKKLLSVEDLTTNYLVYIFPKICRKNVVKTRKSSAKASEKSL